MKSPKQSKSNYDRDSSYSMESSYDFLLNVRDAEVFFNSIIQEIAPNDQLVKAMKNYSLLVQS